MQIISNKGKNEKVRERLVIIIFIVYTVIIAAISTIMQWKNWIAPLMMTGMIVCCLIYMINFRSYYFRALITSVVSWINISVFVLNSGNFLENTALLAAVVVLTSVYGIPDVLHVNLIAYTVHVIYQLFFLKDISIDLTSSDGFKVFVSVISIYIIIHLTSVSSRIQNEVYKALTGNLEAMSLIEHQKDDFMANMSHEIRTPINTIFGLSEIVLSHELPDDVKTEINDIRNSGRELLSIASDIIDFSDLNSGKMEIRQDTYSMTAVINEVINTIAPRTSAKNLELIVDYDASIPETLVGDEQKIRRALMNVLDNAVKFTREGGIILSVKARFEEKYGVNLIISVRDTGIGISDEAIEKIFTSYNQVDTKRNRMESGLGLGLPIAKAIVNKMDGFISINSETDKGTIVQLVIPQAIYEKGASVYVDSPSKIKVMLYINMNKYQYSVIRDGYADAIANMIEGLGINGVSCRNLSDFKQRAEKESFTHVMIGWQEYSEDREYFDALSTEVKVVLILDRNHKDSIEGNKINYVYKPFYIRPIAAILSGKYAESLNHNFNAHFAAPEASVLIVDDNRMNLKVIEGLIRPYHITVHTAEKGKQALKMLDKIHPDIIFMDHMMPEMDGIETFRKIRRRPGIYNQTVPVIALTANTIVGARNMFIDEGFSDYVSKPIEISELERVLYKFIPSSKIVSYSETVQDDTTVEFSDIKSIHIDGIDTMLGITYCSGNPDDYIDIIKVYYNNGISRKDEILRCCEEKDWKNYTILVHALKSTSLTIGAVRLSNMAKRLEAAGKEKQEDIILESNDEMLKEYERILEAIKNSPAVFPKSASPASTVSGENLRELSDEAFVACLDKLSECMETYEIKSVEKYLESLKDCSYNGESLNMILAVAAEKANGFDFMGASEEIRMLRKKVEVS